MNFINKDQLIAELYKVAENNSSIKTLIKEAPSITPEKINKYLTACVEYCSNNMQVNGIVKFSLVDLRNIGRYKTTNGKLEYVSKVCQKHLNFFTVEKKGNGIEQKNTTAMIPKMYKDILMKYEQTQAIEQVVQLKDSILAKETVEVPVKLNRAQIKDAIAYTQYHQKNGKMAKLEPGGREISQLKWMLKNMDEHDVLYQQFEQKSTGRLYSKSGTHTLLSVSKIVRNIAAPQHTIIDINSACFSVFIKIYNELQKHSDRFEPLTHIEYYVSNPKKVRLEIVKDICERHYKDDDNFRPPPGYDTWNTEYKMVKAAFTAIGFGAKTPTPSARGYNACYWTTKNGKWETDSLNEILMRKAEYFVTNPFVVNFINDLKKLNDVILNMVYKEPTNSEEWEIYPGVKIDRKSTPQRQLSLIYQSLERQMLDYIYEALPTDDIMAVMHDGVMMKTPSDPLFHRMEVEKNINKKLVVILPDGEPLPLNGNDIKVSIEKVDNINKEVKDNVDQLALDHREHMARELHEAAIADYEPQFATPSINVNPNAETEVTLASVKALMKKKPAIAEVAAENITADMMMAMCRKPKEKEDWSARKEAEWQKKKEEAMRKWG